MYKYVVFDLDGTLLDTKEGVISAAVQTMIDYGKVVPDLESLEGLIGPPMQKSFEKLYNLSDKEAMEMANHFRDMYKKDAYLFKAEPYNKIFEVLELTQKKNISIGVATYKREDYAKKLLIEKGFLDYFPYIYGSDFEGKLQKQDIIIRCLNDMGCQNYQEAIYIGDGKSDGASANTVGMNFIAVTYGYGFKNIQDAEIYRPVGVASSCDDILKILGI